jgi:hypothetical protein
MRKLAFLKAIKGFIQGEYEKKIWIKLHSDKDIEEVTKGEKGHIVIWLFMVGADRGRYGRIMST